MGGEAWDHDNPTIITLPVRNIKLDYVLIIKEELKP